MRLRLGINTCFAVKRWPRPSDWAPIVREHLGLRLVQHSLDLVDLGTPDAPRTAAESGIRAACNEYDLELHSTFTGLAAYSNNLLLHPEASARADGEAWLEAVIRYTAELGGSATGGHVGAYSVADWHQRPRRDALWDELRRRLLSLAASAHTAGLDYLVVENLAAPREPSTMAMIRDLLTDGDEQRVPISLCLDVGHMCVPGTSGADRDPYAWLRDLGAVAPIIQLQQSDAEGDHHWPFTGQWNSVGRIAADRVIDALGEAGVESAALVLEVIPPFEQDDERVLDDLVASVAYWREALVRSGVAAD